MIQAYAIHGHAKEAFQLFEEMKKKKSVAPDGIIFICLLTACSHAGWADKAWEIFCLMKERFGIDPTPEHEICLVDAWAR